MSSVIRKNTASACSGRGFLQNVDAVEDGSRLLLFLVGQAVTHRGGHVALDVHAVSILVISTGRVGADVHLHKSRPGNVQSLGDRYGRRSRRSGARSSIVYVGIDKRRIFAMF